MPIDVQLSFQTEIDKENTNSKKASLIIYEVGNDSGQIKKENLDDQQEEIDSLIKIALQEEDGEMMKGLMKLKLKGIQNELKKTDFGSSEILRLFKMNKVDVTQMLYHNPSNIICESYQQNAILDILRHLFYYEACELGIYQGKNDLD